MTEYQIRTGGLKGKVIPLIVIILLGGLFYAYQTGMIKGRPTNKVEAPKLDDMSGKYVKDVNYSVAKAPLPDGDELVGKPTLTVNIYDWHANTALPYANGGPITRENSLIGKEGLLVVVVHQDDTNESIKQFISSAVEYKESGGKKGGNFGFTIMGNSSVALLEPLNAELKKRGLSSYEAKEYDLIGKSDGEDQKIGPAEWKTNPDAMRGKIVVGVYDDGDIQGPAVMYADKNGIPVNFDYHTYNPNALNIENVEDFMKAGKIFTSVRELDPRPVVDDTGRRTGKTTKDLGIVLKPDALASWTPVDRNLVRDLSKTDPSRLRGLATISSTGHDEEYKIMPAALVLLNKWAEEPKNFEKLVKLSYATHLAAMQIDKYPDALAKAMEINTTVMGIWDDGGTAKEAAQQRLLAFKGYYPPENKQLHIGGSAVFSARDAMNMLGMTDSRNDLANSTYASVVRSFGNLTVRKYPEKNLKTYRPIEQLFDPRVLRAAYERLQREGLGTTELIAKRDYSKGVGERVGSANFQITFPTNSAKITSFALKVLQEIQDSYAASEYAIDVVGHTDRTGTDARNQPLSEERALAVKEYLIARNPRDFGGARITTEGKGSLEPPKGVDPRYTGSCDQCRRVEIVIHR